MHPSASNNHGREGQASHSLARSAVLLYWLALLASACAPIPKRVVLVVDGQRRVVDTEAVTVDQVLQEQQVVLGDNDRVDPPLYAELARSQTVTVTRVQVKTEKVQQAIPFERTLIRDESYPEGRMRVVQLGENGTIQIVYTITIENGQQVSRRETGRQIVLQPKDEILAIGTQGSLPSIPVAGMVTYLANENAWVMRNDSSDKRPLTTTGDLDGRVFSLSADGRYLLYSRAGAENSTVLNSVWLVDTLVNDPPRQLPLQDVLYAELSGDARTVLYSTGEKTAAAPGWKANNDLWKATLVLANPGSGQGTAELLEAKRLWDASQPAPYSWWGPHLELSPDGRAIAYALTNEIGFSEISASSLVNLPLPRAAFKYFAPFLAPGDWVWEPPVSWSPDSRFVVTVVHAAVDPPNVANDNPLFQVWAFARDGTVAAPLVRQAGMWAAPVWSPVDAKGESNIAYGVALSPSDSEHSLYALYVMNRDGGNKRQIFPEGGEAGLPLVQVAWSPDASQLIVVRDGDLWLYDMASMGWSQLTATGDASLPHWVKSQLINEPIGQ